MNFIFVLRFVGACIKSCEGLSSGNYQSCGGCDVYATCSNGQLIDNRPCSVGTEWDDEIKNCVFSSNTCTESKAYILLQESFFVSLFGGFLKK